MEESTDEHNRGILHNELPEKTHHLRKSEVTFSTLGFILGSHFVSRRISSPNPKLSEMGLAHWEAWYPFRPTWRRNPAENSRILRTSSFLGSGRTSRNRDKGCVARREASRHKNSLNTINLDSVL